MAPVGPHIELARARSLRVQVWEAAFPREGRAARRKIPALLVTEGAMTVDEDEEIECGLTVEGLWEQGKTYIIVGCPNRVETGV